MSNEGQVSPVKIVRTSEGLRDQLFDTLEGLNAGTWTVGVCVSGNAMGLSLADWQALLPNEQAARREVASAKLKRAGAHYVVDSVADLLPVLDDIQQRLARGEGVGECRVPMAA